MKRSVEFDDPSFEIIKEVCVVLSQLFFASWSTPKMEFMIPKADPDGLNLDFIRRLHSFFPFGSSRTY
jgi:hypothetical protein